MTNLDRLAEMWADLDPVDDWRPHIRDAIEEITRLRAALAAPPVAPGWVLVPVEPTLAMQQAALDASRAGKRLLPDCAELWASALVYAAMLAAAPGAPGAPDAQPKEG